MKFVEIQRFDLLRFVFFKSFFLIDLFATIELVVKIIKINKKILTHHAFEILEEKITSVINRKYYQLFS